MGAAERFSRGFRAERCPAVIAVGVSTGRTTGNLAGAQLRRDLMTARQQGGQAGLVKGEPAERLVHGLAAEWRVEGLTPKGLFQGRSATGMGRLGQPRIRRRPADGADVGRQGLAAAMAVRDRKGVRE